MFMTNSKRVGFAILVFVLLVVLDVLARWWFSAGWVDWSLGLLRLEFYANPRLLFSLSFGRMLDLALPVLALSILVFLSWRAYKRQNWPAFTSSVALIILGLLNVGERLTRGYVTDYIRILNGYFNLADFLIIIILLTWLKKSK